MVALAAGALVAGVEGVTVVRGVVMTAIEVSATAVHVVTVVLAATFSTLFCFSSRTPEF